MKFGVGQTVKRIEDANLLIGKGQFTDCLLYTSDAADEV